jgi:hypothetical protein
LGGLSGIEDEFDLDLVNCILNNFKIPKTMTDNGQLTSGDIQNAIWRLITNDEIALGAYSSGTTTLADVDEILTFANSNTCKDYKPPCEGVVGVVLYPISCVTGDPATNAQALIAQAQVTTFPTVCSTDCNICFPTPTGRMLAGTVVEKHHWLRG